MKKLVILVVVFGTQLTFAQNKKNTENKATTSAVISSQSKNESNKSKKLSIEQRANNRTQKLHKKVNLTDKQKVKVNAINLETVKRNDAIRQNKALSQEKRRSEIDSSNKKGWGYIEAYLTKEQLKKLNSNGGKHEFYSETGDN